MEIHQLLALMVSTVWRGLVFVRAVALVGAAAAVATLGVALTVLILLLRRQGRQR